MSAAEGRGPELPTDAGIPAQPDLSPEAGFPAEPELPAEAGFLAPLADRARRGDVLVRRDPDPRDPRVPTRPGPTGTAGTESAGTESAGTPQAVRRSAVLIHLAGTGVHDAHLVLEERGHSMRSQPGQFSLPGGGRDPGDRDDVHTALREAEEETGLDPADVLVLGAFAPIPMPWRVQVVTPVLSWSPTMPPLGVQDPFEVERLVWAPLTGPGSLTDPAHLRRGMLRGFGVGPVFDLPGDAFVWGFTAMIVEKVLTGLGLDPVPQTAPVREIPPERRR